MNGTSNFYYFTGGVATPITGPITGVNGWGNYSGSHCYAFTYNEKTYGANIHSTWPKDFLTIVCTDDLSNILFTKELNAGLSAQSLHSITSEIVDGGYAMNLYVYSQRSGIYVYQLKIKE